MTYTIWLVIAVVADLPAGSGASILFSSMSIMMGLLWLGKTAKSIFIFLFFFFSFIFWLLFFFYIFFFFIFLLMDMQEESNS